MFGLATVGDHALEVGVHIALICVGRWFPAVQCRFDFLHRQVGTFDNAHLDRRAAPRHAGMRPRRQVPLDIKGVGQICLEYNARPQAEKFRFVENLAKGAHR